MTSAIIAAVALTHFTWFDEHKKRHTLRQIVTATPSGLHSSAILLNSR